MRLSGRVEQLKNPWTCLESKTIILEYFFFTFCKEISSRTPFPTPSSIPPPRLDKRVLSELSKGIFVPACHLTTRYHICDSLVSLPRCPETRDDICVFNFVYSYSAANNHIKFSFFLSFKLAHLVAKSGSFCRNFKIKT